MLRPSGVASRCVRCSVRNALARRTRGQVTDDNRRLTLVVAHYRKKPVEVKEPSVLLRINRLYRLTMSATKLYDATRASWKVGHRRGKVKYALAVFDGIVREVYEVKFPRGDGRRDRWEFVGRLADERVRRRYIDRSVGHLSPPGAQNPIAYLNVR